MSTLAVMAGALLLVSTSAFAQGGAYSSITVNSPWVRAAQSGAAVVAGYVTISNSGGRSDRLLSVTSPIAERIEVHETTYTKGGFRMQQLEKLEIAAGASVILKPGGILLMFFKPNRPLRQSSSFSATFLFESAGPVTVEFNVLDPKARGPSFGGPGGS